VATHSAPEKSLKKTVAALSQSDVVKSVESVLRILGSGK
jgi:hypothetical protein